jgi:Ser/Thr protein kinase RdoA (MazF antagonist)
MDHAQSDFSQLAPEEQADRLHRLAMEALDRWSLQPVRVEPVKVRENAVYRVHTGDGRRVALRIHRRGYHSDESLHSELAWMQALSSHGIHVPTPVLSRAGRSFELVDRPDVNGPRQVDVFEWIEGQQLGAMIGSHEGAGAGLGHLYGVMGGLAAQMHNLAAQWVSPPCFRRHAWNRDAFLGESPFWGRFWELDALNTEQRELLLRVRVRAHEDLTAFGMNPDRYGLIHADLVPENVLVAGERLSIIDFDDAGYGWHMFDLATSLYFVRREPFYQEARDALVAGYRRHRPLPDEHLGLLPMFLAIRGTTYLGWVHTRKGEATSRELTPTLIELATAAARDYLNEQVRT